MKLKFIFPLLLLAFAATTAQAQTAVNVVEKDGKAVFVQTVVQEVAVTSDSIEVKIQAIDRQLAALSQERALWVQLKEKAKAIEDKQKQPSAATTEKKHEAGN